MTHVHINALMFKIQKIHFINKTVFVECLKVIGLTSTTLHEWLKNLMPLFHSIRSNSKPTETHSHSFSYKCFTSASSKYFDWFTGL